MLDALRSKRYLIHWQTYRDLFRVEILKYFVVWFSIVPVLAYMFQNVPGELNVPLGVHEIKINFGLPFNWLLLWVASVAYTAALAIYQMRCPHFIRKYNSYGDYQLEVHSPRWIAHLTFHALQLGGKGSRLFERLTMKNYLARDSGRGAEVGEGPREFEVQVEEDATRVYAKHNGELLVFGMPILNAEGEDTKRTAEVEKDVFWEVFGYYAGSRLLARSLILALLVIALLLFVVVILQHLLSVVPYARQHWPWLPLSWLPG